MPLSAYRAKRNFAATEEPRGKVAPGDSRKRFVVQKHAASHLHYDFRLELDGVLLSWAIPKGPSLDPAVRRLAIEVEDHPVEYAEFEGSIPAGEYGGGTVMLWDEGTWEPVGDPRAGYAKGHLKFTLHGKRLRGAWSLVRTHGSRHGGKLGDKAWLLFKAADAAAQRTGTPVIERHAVSVRSGRSMDAIGHRRDRARHTEGRAARLREQLRPMLATLVDRVPAGEGWQHEIKYDGYRMLARIARGAITLHSRNGRDWSASFPQVARDLARVRVREAWIDGEVVVVDERGRPSFQRLQQALAEPAGSEFLYFAFDLPFADGRDLRALPLVERKTLLRSAIGDGVGCVRIGPEAVGGGSDFLRQSCALGLEGVVSKRIDSAYADGRRTRDWVKFKCLRRQELVIGGYTAPQGSRQEFGALLLGVHDGEGLRYAGKVGTGFDVAALRRIGKLLRARERASPPFIDPPRGPAAGSVRWVRPDLVAEVAFTEWSEGGALRHPSFRGLRSDKDARRVVRERATPPPMSRRDARRVGNAPAATRAAEDGSAHWPAGVTLTHADRLYFPEAKVTKLALARYYEEMAPAMLPHYAARPLSLVRCPEGRTGQCFYQKNASPHVDAEVARLEVATSKGAATYMSARTARALVALVQWGVVELHPWGGRAPRLDLCDTLVFDFDPHDSVRWPTLVESVGVLRTLLDDLSLTGFLKTTGGKGLHLVVPVRPALPWTKAKAFAKGVATLLARTFPQRFTATLAKDRRDGRIFVDWLRNGEGATSVGPYSVRARRNAPVATPIAWDELGVDVRFDHFNVGNVRQRMREVADPWAGYFAVRQSVTKAMAARVDVRW